MTFLSDPLSGNPVVGIVDESDCELRCVAQLVRENLHAQVVDVSNNCLKTLRPLQNLRDLVSLNASNNLLTAVLDFETPSCRTEEKNNSDTGEQLYDSKLSWSKGFMWTGSNLEYADLSYNKITSLANLSWHKNLRVLDLSNNQICRVGDLSSLVHLEELNLANNKLGGVRALGTLEGLQTLRISDNCLTDFSNFSQQFPGLRFLHCAGNKIENLRGLEHVSKLEELDVSRNCIRRFGQLDVLQGLVMLTVLLISGNPIELETGNEDMLRLRVLFRLEQLCMLNNVVLSAQDKVRAKNFYGEDLESRKKAFAGVYPSQEFVAKVEPFQDPEVRDAKVAPSVAADMVGAAVWHAQESVLRSPLYTSRVFVDKLFHGIINKIE